jgi:glutathione S-transferase
MQLISLPVSPFAARVRIAIYAKELDVTVVPPPVGWPLSRHILGPIGRVPILICDDGVIPESQVILEYLEEAFPNTRPLLPRSLEERARVRLISRVVDLYLMPPIVALANSIARDEQQDVRAMADALGVLDGQIGGGACAVGETLTLADCALAPALFAALVTGQRLGLSPLEGHANLERYVSRIEQQEEVERVLLEMTEGLKRMEGG